jgi:hypothetical protein
VTRTRALLLVGFLVALGLAGGVSYYASNAPDGLTKVAADQGFDGAQDHPLADSPVAGYEVRGVHDGRLSGGLAGVAGVLVTLAIGGLLFRVVRGGRQPDQPGRLSQPDQPGPASRPDQPGGAAQPGPAGPAGRAEGGAGDAEPAARR